MEKAEINEFRKIFGENFNRVFEGVVMLRRGNNISFRLSDPTLIDPLVSLIKMENDGMFFTVFDFQNENAGEIADQILELDLNFPGQHVKEHPNDAFILINPINNKETGSITRLANGARVCLITSNADSNANIHVQQVRGENTSLTISL